MAKKREIFMQPDNNIEEQLETFAGYDKVNIKFSTLHDADFFGSVRVNKSKKTEIDHGVYYTKVAIESLHENIALIDTPYIVAQTSELYQKTKKEVESYLSANGLNYEYIEPVELEDKLQPFKKQVRKEILQNTKKLITIAADYKVWRKITSRVSSTIDRLTKKNYLDMYLNQLQKRMVLYPTASSIQLPYIWFTKEYFNSRYYELDFSNDRLLAVKVYLKYFQLGNDGRFTKKIKPISVNLDYMFDEIFDYLDGSLIDNNLLAQQQLQKLRQNESEDYFKELQNRELTYGYYWIAIRDNNPVLVVFFDKFKLHEVVRFILKYATPIVQRDTVNVYEEIEIEEIASQLFPENPNKLIKLLSQYFIAEDLADEYLELSYSSTDKDIIASYSYLEKLCEQCKKENSDKCKARTSCSVLTACRAI